ncbi:MAG: hypothetical protein QNJ98_00020 [Planctomycetota bacterium]|nr:hypothetical protein [Planctomycetota bacterium]
MRRALLGCVLLLLCCAYVPAPSASADDPRTRTRRGWDYVVTLAPDLKSVDVRICFRRFLPRQLELKDARGLGALSFPADASGTQLARSAREGAVVPRGLRAGGCVRYRVDLDAALKAGDRQSARIGRDVMINPGNVLLRPTVWPNGVYVTCRFVCPGELNVSVPWPDVAGASTPHTYQVGRHALTLDALIALGRFAPESFDASGATFRIARLDRRHKASREDVEAWISAAAGAVTNLYGRYPMSPVQVVLLPAGSWNSPVSFGRARRAGGASTLFYLSQVATKDDLIGEWVAVHEMIHLGMPWTPLSEAWFQEGFTTYYQEVLRTRAGFQSVEQGWQEIHEGFGRGRIGGPGDTLKVTSENMHRTHAYWRVYWGGCAIALMIDVELRRVFKGTRSLDDVIRYLSGRYAYAGASYTGMALLEDADRWLGRSLCAPIARRVLQARGFPDLTATYRRLGLVDAGGHIRLDPRAPQAKDARAIMTAK